MRNLILFTVLLGIAASPALAQGRPVDRPLPARERQEREGPAPRPQERQKAKAPQERAAQGARRCPHCGKPLRKGAAKQPGRRGPAGGRSGEWVPGPMRGQQFRFRGFQARQPMPMQRGAQLRAQFQPLWMRLRMHAQQRGFAQQGQQPQRAQVPMRRPAPEAAPAPRRAAPERQPAPPRAVEVRAAQPGQGRRVIRAARIEI